MEGGGGGNVPTYQHFSIVQIRIGNVASSYKSFTKYNLYKKKQGHKPFLSLYVLHIKMNGRGTESDLIIAKKLGMLRRIQLKRKF